MTNLLKGKVALITGGTRGIGKSIVETFSLNGAKVAFTYISSNREAKDIEKYLYKYNKIKSYKLDGSKYNESEKKINEIINEFGKIDILVNNSGITEDSLLIRMSDTSFDKVIKNNLYSIFNISKFVVQNMIKNKSGSIINMSSIVGINGNAGQTNYSASKSAIIGFTKSLSRELGIRNIRCNTICPGFINTEMTNKLNEKVVNNWINNISLKRAGNSKEVANLALFLASDLSSYITGETIRIDGGM